MPKIVECVPNFSEGRNRATIDAIAEAIAVVTGVKLLDVDPGADTNRTVYTFVGPPDEVIEAAMRAAHAAAQRIDMSHHAGAHPRLGALDVCPIVPVANVSMNECVALARTLGRRLAEELHITVYFYEHAATRDERRSLANIRAGEYEGLERKLADPAWAPDCGPATFNRRLGATVVGAREFLIAYNVNLNTRDKRLAQEIALNIRESGHGKGTTTGRRLKAVRAIGWYIEHYGQAQVSINLIDYKTTALHEVFEAVRGEAEQLGLSVTGSELIGMTPLQPIVDAGRYYLKKRGEPSGAPERELVEIAVHSLGLDDVAPFHPEKKIIEYAMRSPSPLLSLSVERFVDEVSSASPAPGGGSVAALAGGLAAALSAMVANLTVGKRDYEHVRSELSALAEQAQETKRALLERVEEDARAYAQVVGAIRMSRETDEERTARRSALDGALKDATKVPLETARLSLKALDLARIAAVRGYSQAASDAAVGALLARAAVEGAALNVFANVKSIKDDEFNRTCRVEAERLVAEAKRIFDDVVQRVKDGNEDDG